MSQTPQEYVSSLRAQGVRDPDIARALRQAGWTRAEIRALLHPPLLLPPPPPALLPPEPPPSEVRFPPTESSEPTRPWWRGCWPSCLGCLALLVIAGMMLFPVFARPRYKSSNNCLSNIKQLMLAEIMYASDNHERFPSAQDWPRQLYPYVKNSQIYVCPSDPSPRQYPYEPREQSYTMNLAANELDSTRFVAPASLVVIFDGNSLYGLTAAAAFRHNDGANVGFADGHAKWVARQSFTVDLLQPPGLQGRPLSPWAPAASGWGGGGPP